MIEKKEIPKEIEDFKKYLLDGTKIRFEGSRQLMPFVMIHLENGNNEIFMHEGFTDNNSKDLFTKLLRKRCIEGKAKLVGSVFETWYIADPIAAMDYQNNSAKYDHNMENHPAAGEALSILIETPTEAYGLRVPIEKGRKLGQPTPLTSIRLSGRARVLSPAGRPDWH